MTCQVEDVRRPLLSVRQLMEKGSLVSFGPGEGDSFICHPQSQVRIPLVKQGGAFIIKATFVETGLTSFARPARGAQIAIVP